MFWHKWTVEEFRECVTFQFTVLHRISMSRCVWKKCGRELKIKYHSISRARISSGFMVWRSVDNACYKAQGLGFQAGLRCTMTYFYLCCISHLETLSKQSLPFLWTAVIPRAISPYQITSCTHKRTSTTPCWQENTIHILSQKRRTIIYNDVTNTGFHASTHNRFILLYQI